jgi:hypothetical protein
MAYVSATDTELLDTNSATFTPALLDHVADDLLMICLTQDTGSTAISTVSSGWAMIGTQAASGGARQAWAYKVATSSSEPDPTFSGTTDTWIADKYVIKDADPTTPINANARGDWNNPVTSTASSPSLTTTSNNCLIMHSIGGDANWTAYVTPNLLQMETLTQGTAETSQTGWRNQLTSGSASVFTWQLSTNAEGGNVWAIAINNKSGGVLAPFCGESITPISVYGAGALNRTMTALSGIAATIGGVPTSATAMTSSNVSIPEIYGAGQQFLSTITTGTLVYQGAVDTLASPIDISGKLISFVWRSSASTAQMLSTGMFFIVSDTSGNYVVYNLIRRPPFLINQTYVFVAEIGQGSIFASSGTIDYAQINRFGWFMGRSSALTQNGSIIIKNLYLHTKATASGGASIVPVNVNTFYRSITGGLIGFGTSSIQGSGQYLAKTPLQFGDGTTPTYVSLFSQSIEIPETNDSYVRPRTQKYLPDVNNVDVTIYASATDTMDFASSIFASQQNNAFTINASSSVSASYDFTGCSIIGFSVTNNVVGITFNGATFSETRGITLNGGSIDSCFIGNSTTSPAVTTNNPRITSTSFTSAGIGHAIELTAIGTFDFEGNTFTGYGADGTTDAAIYNNSGGLVTLNIPVGEPIPTIRNGVGAATTIVQPTDNQKVILNGGVANSRIQLYDLTSNTELAEQIVTTFPFTWDDPNPYVADREIRLRVAYQNGVTAKLFIDQVIGTATELEPTINFLINQEDDAVYIANAIDGSTVTDVVIDDTALLVEVDTGSITFGRLYAYEVYWLYTSAGIVDEGKYINAIDPANYLFENIKIKNVTSPTVPLVITGGWGRDSVTNQTIDIIDTSGGTIFSNPDLVIAYGAGGTNPWDATLAANNDPGTFGERVQKLLTKNQYVGLS